MLDLQSGLLMGFLGCTITFVGFFIAFLACTDGLVIEL